MSPDVKTSDTMSRIVGSDRADVVNSGAVSDSDTQSKSLLAQKQSVARTSGTTATAAPSTSRIGKGGNLASKLSAHTPSSDRGAAGQGASVEGDAPAKALNAKRRATLASNARIAAGNAIAEELDDTPEFEGASKVHGNASRAKVIAKRMAKGRETAGCKAKGAHTASASASSKKVSAGAKSAKAAQKEAAKAGAAAATVEKAATAKSIGAAIGSALAPVAGVLAGILAFVLCVLVISQLISALFGFWKNESDKQKMEGLPSYITYEMVEAALECQEDYGHPAGCTLAQIICESGQGDHMSQLATRDHNLFGIKWASSFASCPEVAGKSAWQTNEVYNGQTVTITAYFTVFKSDVDCIKFRSRVFLQQSHFKNQDNIKAAIAEHDSDKMAQGLKDGGWATSPTYVESLKTIMDTYNLRRFDTMSLETLKNMGEARATVVQAAYSQIGVPYVWGGTTPGVGLDCSGLTQYCYKQAGISIPRNSEDQANSGTKIPVSQAKPGDILWRPGHVAIYVGDDKYVHEPHSGSSCRESSGASYFTAAIQVII